MAEGVRVVDNPQGERYEIWVGATRAGILDYRRKPSGVVLVHTEIDPAFEGQGLGSRLVADVLADLRGRDLKLVPVCPFVGDYLRRHPEQRDLVARSRAGRS